jgi:predicted dehydrogenase
MMKTYRIGLIGAGFMGRTHTYCWRVLPLFYEDLPFRVALEGVCTSRLSTAEAARAKLGYARAFSGTGELVADPRIDIVDIASPNVYHHEALLAAHRAGKKVYCDKPLTGTIEQAREIERRVDDPDYLGQMTLQYRFLPATMRARQLIAEEALGEIIGFRGCYLHSGNIVPRKALTWKEQRRFGGGVLYDMGVHILDLLTWLVDSPCTEVYARRMAVHGKDPRESDDRTTVMAILHNGAEGTIEASKIATGAQDELRFEIHGSRGALRFNLMQPNYLDFFDTADPERPLGGRSGYTSIHCIGRYPEPAGRFPPPKFTTGWLRAHLHCLYTFIDAVHRGASFDPSIGRGLALEKMLDAIGRSADRNAPVTV